jgi:hypothetical protein
MLGVFAFLCSFIFSVSTQDMPPPVQWTYSDYKGHVENVGQPPIISKGTIAFQRKTPLPAVVTEYYTYMEGSSNGQSFRSTEYFYTDSNNIDMYTLLQDFPCHHVKQLRNCSAWVKSDDNVWLQTCYGTVVALTTIALDNDNVFLKSTINITMNGGVQVTYGELISTKNYPNPAPSSLFKLPNSCTRNGTRST